MRRDRGTIKSPTHHIRMIKGRHPRHRFATPPVALKQGFRGGTPFPAVFGTLRGYVPFPIVLVPPRRCAPFLVVPITLRGRTPFSVVRGTLSRCRPFPRVLIKLRGCTSFPLVFVRFLSHLRRFRCGSWVHVFYSLDKTAKLGVCLATALPKCGAGSTRGHRTSVLAVLPNCTRGSGDKLQWICDGDVPTRFWRVLLLRLPLLTHGRYTLLHL